MRCTHQGAELQVFGDKLQCPAHGSEFSSKGAVQNGPADNTLRTFPVTIEKNQLKISLKAV
jgi:Rieske Fe-S protein